MNNSRCDYFKLCVRQRLSGVVPVVLHGKEDIDISPAAVTTEVDVAEIEIPIE